MSLSDEQACATLCARYAYYVDRQRDRVADLFTDNAVLAVIGRTMHGLEEIRRRMAPRTRPVTLHFCCNTIIDSEDEDNARGTTHMFSLVYDGEETEFPLPMPVPSSGAIYFDRFRRVG